MPPKKTLPAAQPTKEPTMEVVAGTNGSRPAAGGGPDRVTYNHGLKDEFADPYLQQSSLQPTSNVVEFFLTFSPIPEEAWVKAGMPLTIAARKRRRVMRFNYIFYGIMDVMGDLYTSLAAWYGHDRKAIDNAVDVATNTRMMRAQDMPNVSDRFRGERPNNTTKAP